MSASPQRRKSPSRVSTPASPSRRSQLREPPPDRPENNGSHSPPEAGSSNNRYGTPIQPEIPMDADEQEIFSSSGLNSPHRRRTIGGSSAVFSTPMGSPTSNNNTSLYSTNRFSVGGVSESPGPIRNMKRYSSYLNYFKDSSASGLENRRLFSPPSSSSPLNSVRRSTAFNMVSNISEDEDEDSGEERPSRFASFAHSINPVNWFGRGYRKAKEAAPVEEPRLSTTRFSTPSASPRFSSGREQHTTYNTGGFGGSPIPPSVTVRRPPRERNGSTTTSHPNNLPSSDNTIDETGGSHVISTIILTVFFLGMSLLVLAYLWQTNQALFPALPGFVSEQPKFLDKVHESGYNKVKVEVQPPAPKLPVRSSYPVCGLVGVDPNVSFKNTGFPLCLTNCIQMFTLLQACIDKIHAKSAKIMFTALHKELLDRARWVGCGTHVDEKVNLKTAKVLLYSLTTLVCFFTYHR